MDLPAKSVTSSAFHVRRQNKNVGGERTDQFRQSLDLGGSADDFHIPLLFNKETEPFPKQVVIIGYQYSDAHQSDTS